MNTTHSINVIVNGQGVQVDTGSTLRALIEYMKLGQSACAAEVNKTFIPRREHEKHMLQDGDTIELVSLVGGG